MTGRAGDARSRYIAVGIGSCAHWLAWTCSLSPGAAREHADRVVAKMTKSLRPGKIFIDWSQNSDFKTTVSVYSLRAKHEQPFVSMPVEWDELESAVKKRDAAALRFTPEAALKRVAKAGDGFAGVLALKQRLPKDFGERGGPPGRRS